MAVKKKKSPPRWMLSAAEHASLHFAKSQGYGNLRRVVRTRGYGPQDIWSADVLGMNEEGGKIWIQATCGQMDAVRKRRNKIGKYPWHHTDKVYVLQLCRKKTVGRSHDYWLRLWLMGARKGKKDHSRFWWEQEVIELSGRDDDWLKTFEA